MVCWADSLESGLNLSVYVYCLLTVLYLDQVIQLSISVFSSVNRKCDGFRPGNSDYFLLHFAFLVGREVFVSVVF